MLSQAKLIGGGALILFISLSVWGAYNYVTNLQEQVVFQAEEIKTLDIANLTLTNERNQLKVDLVVNAEDKEVLHEELREARASKDALIQLFSDHDFTNLVNKKPGLIENIINKGTDKVFKELEDISDE